MSTTAEQSTEQPASAPAGPAATPDAGAPAATPAAAAPASRGPGKRGAEAAVDRARARMSAPGGSPQSQPETGAAAAAATAESADGAGEAAAAQGGKPPAGDQATGGQGGDKSATTADSIAAPDDWPEAQKAAFKSLPTDEARTLFLQQYKDMQAGFTSKLQDIAQIRTQHGALVDAMQQHGQTADSLIELMGTAQSFATDPKGTLARLAAQAGVEVFFERPTAEGEIPEFETQADMAKWFSEQAEAKARKLLDERDRQAAAETRRAQAREAIQRQFGEAQTQHNDFESHRPAVVDILAAIAEQGPSVEQAYRLATYEGLQKLATEGQQAAAELKALKAQQEATAKRSTTVPASASRSGKDVNPEAKNLSPGERALARARSRISAAINGGRAA